MIMNQDFRLASIFQDNMVLQADKPIRFFGECSPKVKIHIEFLDYRYEFHPLEPDFLFALAPLPVINKPFELTIYSDNQKEIIKNCLVGDVFICGGQSNMAFTVNEAINIERVDNLNIRLFEVPKLPYEGAEVDFEWLYQNNPKWLIQEKDSIGWFSAIGYFVANKLYDKIDRPIGIISLNMGDTTVFTWIDEDSQKHDDSIKFYWEQYQKELKKYKTEKAYEEEFKKKFYALMEFYGEIEKGVSLGLSSEESHKRAYEKVPDPFPPMGPMHQNRPAGLFETMVKRVVPYSSKAILYYQGENDKLNYRVYKHAMDVFTACWRKHFKDELPIVIVQIAGYEYFDVEELAVAKLRDAQADFLNVAEKKYVACGADAGERYNIHPKDKNKIAERLTNVLLEYVYHQKKNTISPQVSSFERKDNLIRLKIINNKLPLRSTGKQGCFKGLNDKGEIFDIVEYNIESDAIEIKIDSDITEIRYGYENFPNMFIYSENDLPLLPFRILIR